MIDRIFVFTPAQASSEHPADVREFPQRQKSASFNLEQVMAKLQEAPSAAADDTVNATTTAVACSAWQHADAVLGGSQQVPVAEAEAACSTNDGTLWCEAEGYLLSFQLLRRAPAPSTSERLRHLDHGPKEPFQSDLQGAFCCRGQAKDSAKSPARLGRPTPSLS